MEKTKKGLSVIEMIIWVFYALFVVTMVLSGIGSYREYEPEPGFWFTLIALISLAVGSGVLFWRWKLKKDSA